MVSADREEKKGIKGGVDKDDCRKNRQAQKVELRKAKRDEGLQKRRNMAVVQVDVSDPVDDAATPEKGNASGAAPTFDQNCQTALGFVARNGPAEEYDVALAAVRALRKELSLARNPPIDDCINQNMVPAFVTMLGHPEAKLQFEAAWCLTNIASGTSKQCEVVVQNNGVAPLVGLMGSPNLDVCEQAVWAIGNIAGDCAGMRDLVLANGAAERVLKMIEVCALMLPPPDAFGVGPQHPSYLLALFAHPSIHPSLHSNTGDRLDGPDGPASQRGLGALQPHARQAAAVGRPRLPGHPDLGEASYDR
jgi:importin subunit alpha-1